MGLTAEACKVKGFARVKGAEAEKERERREPFTRGGGGGGMTGGLLFSKEDAKNRQKA